MCELKVRNHTVYWVDQETSLISSLNSFFFAWVVYSIISCTSGTLYIVKSRNSGVYSHLVLLKCLQTVIPFSVCSNTLQYTVIYSLHSCFWRLFHILYIGSCFFSLTEFIKYNPTLFCILKGQCYEIFDFRFSTWISFPQAPDYTIWAVSDFFSKIRGDIRSSRVYHRCRWHLWQMENSSIRKICIILLDIFG